MIDRQAVAMTAAMRDTMTDRWSGLVNWFQDNSEALSVGTLVALALVALMLVLRDVGRRICSTSPDLRSWKAVLGRVLEKTSLAFMIIAALAIVTNFAEPPERVARILEILVIIAFAIQGAVWARELILGVIGRRAGEDPGETTLGNAMSVIRVLVSIALFAIAFIVILDNLGVNVTALIAGLGIGGIAIGLAAQGIFSDLFAALAILFDKPFKRGDVIRYDNSIGTVERIGLKTTRLRSLTGEQLVMANTKLLEREIHNLAQAKARRMTLYFAVESKAADTTLDAIAEAAEAAIASQKGCKLVRAVLAGVGSGALAHELVYDDPSRDNDRIARNRSAILRALIASLAERKVELVQASNLPPPLAPF